MTPPAWLSRLTLWASVTAGWVVFGVLVALAARPHLGWLTFDSSAPRTPAPALVGAREFEGRAAGAIAAATVPPSVTEPLEPQFAVAVRPVACLSEPDAAAAIATWRPAGDVLTVVARRVQPDGTWYRESTQSCWLRGTPGTSVRLFTVARRAECFAVAFRRPVPLVTDCVAILSVSGGQVTVAAPPGARCTASGMTTAGGTLRITELPAARVDDHGEVTWAWGIDSAAPAGTRTLTVTCSPGGTASITVTSG